VLCSFTDEKEARKQKESPDFALVDFYDSIGVVPMEWVKMKTYTDGLVDDKLATII